MLERLALRWVCVSQAFGNQPRLGGVKGLVDLIGMCHDFTDRTTVFARFQFIANSCSGLCPVCCQSGVARIGKLTIKIFADEISRTAGDIDVFTHQIAVDARDKIIRIKVNVFDAGVEFGCDVIAHPFGVHAQLQITQR